MMPSKKRENSWIRISACYINLRMFEQANEEFLSQSCLTEKEKSQFLQE
jgi:hypothetical protein